MTMRDGQGFSKLVTLETLYVLPPCFKRRAEVKGPAGEDDRDRHPPIRNWRQPRRYLEELQYGSRCPRAIYRPRRQERRRPGEVEPVTLEVVPVDRGPLLWRKPNLPASDVQRQPGNPTGGLRLTQAKFTAEGRRIDQTSYFRNTLFGGLPWTTKRPTPFVESTTVRFDVTILGQPFGIQQLEISHKPSGGKTRPIIRQFFIGEI